jgi:hypothetical protein
VHDALLAYAWSTPRSLNAICSTSPGGSVSGFECCEGRRRDELHRDVARFLAHHGVEDRDVCGWRSFPASEASFRNWERCIAPKLVAEHPGSRVLSATSRPVKVSFAGTLFGRSLAEQLLTSLPTWRPKQAQAFTYAVFTVV